MSEGKETEKQASALTRLGWLLTGAWMLIFVFLVVWRWNQFVDLDLNELGDFLAGWFAPLAFGWLVLGFYQQGAELRLQAIELKNSVVELAKQSKVMSESASYVQQATISTAFEKQQAAIAMEAREVLELLEHKKKFAVKNTQVNIGFRDIESVARTYNDGDVDVFHHHILQVYERLDMYNGHDVYFQDHPRAVELASAMENHEKALTQAEEELRQLGANEAVIEKLQNGKITQVRERLTLSKEFLDQEKQG